MTAPLFLLLLLLPAAALAACLDGYFPPGAVLVSAAPFNGTALYAGGGEVYVQRGVEALDRDLAYSILQRLCRYVAVHPSLEGEVWCSPDGVRWAWLRWLPLRYPAVWRGESGLARVNATVCTPIGDFQGAVPPGWYTDRRAVYSIPEELPPPPAEEEKWREEVEELQRAVEKLRKELNATRAALEAERAKADELEAIAAELEERAEALEAESALRLYLALALGAAAAALAAYVLKQRLNQFIG